MTKDEISTHLAKHGGMTKADASRAYDALIDLIAVELRSGRDFLIRDIGTLKPRQAEARTGRNPATGAAIAIPARKSVKFKIAQGLSSQLNA